MKWLVLLIGLLCTPVMADGFLGGADRLTFTPIAAPSTPIQFMQIFAPTDTSPLPGTRGFAWSNATPITGVYTTYYTLAYRLYVNPGTNLKCSVAHDCLAWLYANHPDWIMYLNDQTTPAYEFGNTDFPPINLVGSRTVDDAVLTQYSTLAAGFQGIGLDNAGANNSFLQAGHYAGATPGCGTAPSFCGSWVQDFGGVSSTDAAFSAALMTYLDYMRPSIAHMGLTYFLNLSESPTAAHKLANGYTNGSMAEGWPQHSCDTTANTYLNGFVIDNQWQTEYSDIINDSQKWWAALSYLCGHNTSGMTAAEESYSTANYLLAVQNPSQNYLSADLAGSHLYANYPASMTPPVGPYSDRAPLPASCGGTGVGTDAGVCVRKWYSDSGKTTVNGIAVVNSSGENTLSYTLAAGDWVDQFCNVVTAGSVSFAPATAMVILSHPNTLCP